MFISKLPRTMFVRCIMAALIPLCGMRGLQSCIGEAGHFHLEVAHSHDDHCDGHPDPCGPPDGLQCEHSDDHFHIGLTIDDPANHSTTGVTVKKGEPRVLATLPPAPATSSVAEVSLRPSEIPRTCNSSSSYNYVLSTIILRI